MGKEEDRRQKNVLKIGLSTLGEIEEKVKAFRIINPASYQKRFIVAAQEIKDKEGNILIAKGEAIDLAKVIMMRRFFAVGDVFKTYQPDVAIALVTEMNSPEGIKLSMDLVTNIMNIGRGLYQTMIERIDSLADLNTMLQGKKLFPRLIIIGHIPVEKLAHEMEMFKIIRKNEPYKLLQGYKYLMKSKYSKNNY